MLRGAFGTIFRRLACLPECSQARTCEWRATCPYARLFEPSALTRGPSGLADSPRPFVFRAMHLDDLTIAAGGPFHFDLNLFDTNTRSIAYLVRTFAELAQEGLGAGRKRVELTRVSQLDERGKPAQILYDGGSSSVQIPAPVELSLDPATETVSRVEVRFITPTELKSSRQLAETPEFPILAARIRDRIGTLRELYSDGPLDMDFRAFAEHAALIRMIRCEIANVKLERRSSRTGQVHPIGGFIGSAEYEGDLTEFASYLNAAQWTGVGRQTVWGKGQILIG